MSFSSYSGLAAGMLTMQTNASKLEEALKALFAANSFKKYQYYNSEQISQSINKVTTFDKPSCDSCLSKTSSDRWQKLEKNPILSLLFIAKVM